MMNFESCSTERPITQVFSNILDHNEKRTYTVEEIQNILEISRTTAYSIIKRNLFHSVKIGGHIRISKKSFDKWLDSGAVCQVCDETI
jgi:DNA binding domain, excisionase family